MGTKAKAKLTYTISTAAGGNMSFLFGERDEVLANRRKFLLKTGIDLGQCATVRLKHEDRIFTVTENNAGAGMRDLESAPEADALITKEMGIGLFLMVADCAPALVYDPVKSVLALVHLGWRGVEEHLIQKVIMRMVRDYGSKIEDMEILIGPAIQKESYKFEVPPQKEFPGWESYIFKDSDNLYHVDFLSYIKDQLLELKIKEGQFSVSSIDTFSSNEYFSHRRSELTGEKEGRFAVVAVMK
jgi:YfiH family protein